MSAKVQFTVFTKPWKTMRLPELGRFVKRLGFDGVELPVRPGFQVQPEDVTRGLPEAGRILADCGLRIASVAGPTDEPTIAACAEAGARIIRICVEIDKDATCADAEARVQKRFDELLPVLAGHGVKIGVQNHCGRSITTAAGLLRLVEKYDPGQIAAVLDFGHSGLAGEAPDLALEVVWSHLGLVNFKSAYWQRASGSEPGAAEWRAYWTSGRDGMANWPAAVEALERRNYQGDVCLTAEYAQPDRVNSLIAEDLGFAKSLFARSGGG